MHEHFLFRGGWGECRSQSKRYFSSSRTLRSKNLWVAKEIRTGAVGWEDRMLPLCLLFCWIAIKAGDFLSKKNLRHHRGDVEDVRTLKSRKKHTSYGLMTAIRFEPGITGKEEHMRPLCCGVPLLGRTQLSLMPFTDGRTFDFHCDILFFGTTTTTTTTTTATTTKKEAKSRKAISRLI